MTRMDERAVRRVRWMARAALWLAGALVLLLVLSAAGAAVPVSPDQWRDALADEAASVQRILALVCVALSAGLVGCVGFVARVHGQIFARLNDVIDRNTAALTRCEDRQRALGGK